MKSAAHDFPARARAGLRNPDLARAMARTVNLVCGPSKTGDVELVILEGAHGPRRLHVVVVRE